MSASDSPIKDPPNEYGNGVEERKGREGKRAKRKKRGVYIVFFLH